MGKIINWENIPIPKLPRWFYILIGVAVVLAVFMLGITVIYYGPIETFQAIRHLIYGAEGAK